MRVFLIGLCVFFAEFAIAAIYPNTICSMGCGGDAYIFESGPILFRFASSDSPLHQNFTLALRGAGLISTDELVRDVRFRLLPNQCTFDPKDVRALSCKGEAGFAYFETENKGSVLTGYSLPSPTELSIKRDPNGTQGDEYILDLKFTPEGNPITVHLDTFFCH